MLTNEGTWDRAFRIFLGIVLGYAAWIAWPGTLAVVSAAVGCISLVTGLVGWCALYALFGFSTKKKAVV